MFRPGAEKQMTRTTRFCSKPFKRAQIARSGLVFFCCQNWLPVPIGNCFTKTFEEIWNSSVARKIRMTVLDGSLAMCKPELCPAMVSGLVENPRERRGYRRIIRGKTTELRKGPEQISLNYDFTCDLKCPSCRNHIEVLPEERKNHLILFQKELLESEVFRQVRRLTVSGAGEALASDVFLDLFARISRRRFPKLRITLRSNGLLLTREKWRELANIQYAVDTISVSLDAATEATYERLRQKGVFPTILKNLTDFSFPSSKQSLKLNFVVQEANFREMPAFVQLARRLGATTVAFTRLLHTDAIPENTFNAMAIHLPTHPRHRELLAILGNPIFSDPIVQFRNLSHLRIKAEAGH